ncbi:hypothetical protein I3843_15G139700 [Carya illinoinensis]|uniref:Late embryogenesis abundant protein LEA-2 subgroup domain-containing protein n=1 Tax=Carya illinoinensis TaxID=32201 RepID=A0A8T1NC32_CARIL|nr:uncharacterized protein LOC122297536 [Carya illinoinensis]XP_042963569.1 uncharacterized protein LOC122297536 [Carya illinoinensis]XP_042963570.1 uncharacterized protein LOC122297536 [Carya illinoinensis]XP_042963572.1 uncharacterized protein LOC122297536 [Carya illinoinensis]KAG2668096.1 hypothetical protein I3760_15G144100 [Carya illinoinensis]KAG2668097.1 hypothetical protein I3760_15G144100 [Carya illinoinensis]KAG2668098.1 hypothetical protein I3760_15G144100 [Carya illinoinensis]KAG
MDVEGKALKAGGWSSSTPTLASSRKRRKTCCLAVIGTTIGIVILIVILAFTVFKAKRPVTTFDDLSIKDLDFSFDIARLAVRLNVTLDVDVSVKNPNKVGFKYSNSTVILNYRGELVGEAPLLPDKISAGETKHMNLSLTVLADRLLFNTKLYSDVTSGILPFNTYIKLPGKVKILFFNIHATTSSSCDFDIYISNRTISEQRCKYKTKF